MTFSTWVLKCNNYCSKSAVAPVLATSSNWKDAVSFPPPSALWWTRQLAVELGPYARTVRVLVVVHFFLSASNLCLVSPTQPWGKKTLKCFLVKSNLMKNLPGTICITSLRYNRLLCTSDSLCKWIAWDPKDSKVTFSSLAAKCRPCCPSCSQPKASAYSVTHVGKFPCCRAHTVCRTAMGCPNTQRHFLSLLSRINHLLVAVALMHKDLLVCSMVEV